MRAWPPRYRTSPSPSDAFNVDHAIKQHQQALEKNQPAVLTLETLIKELRREQQRRQECEHQLQEISNGLIPRSPTDIGSNFLGDASEAHENHQQALKAMTDDYTKFASLMDNVGDDDERRDVRREAWVDFCATMDSHCDEKGVLAQSEQRLQHAYRQELIKQRQLSAYYRNKARIDRGRRLRDQRTLKRSLEIATTLDSDDITINTAHQAVCIMKAAIEDGLQELRVVLRGGERAI